jgi:hypothetical protein
VRIVEIFDIGSDIFDLFPFEEFECSEYLVGNPFLEE